MTRTANEIAAITAADITTIAKAIRVDIKAAIKAGDLPGGIKVSVTTSRYAGGRSLTATIKAFPGSVHTVEFLDAVTADPTDGLGDLRFSPYMRQAIETLKGIVDRYNWDRSDAMRDYFNVNFYGWVKVAHDLQMAERAAYAEAARARAAAAVIGRVIRAVAAPAAVASVAGAVQLALF